MSFTSLFRIGVVGHRYLDIEQTLFVQSCCRVLLSRFHQTRNVVALTALAEGTDTIFAEEALELGVALGVVLPYHNYVEDFRSSDARQRYQRLKSQADYEIRHPFASRSDAAYLAAMDWIVDNSELVIIAWSGKKYQGLRATEIAVHRCIRTNRHWVHLDIQKLTMSFDYGSMQTERYLNTGSIQRQRG